jgi:hypothetical protein
VTCYSDRLVVHLYYFPFGGKTIKYRDIRSCKLFRQNDLNFFETKCWGMALSPVWWHMDFHRPWRKYYIILDANQWPKIGITMNDDDTIKVYNLIKKKIALILSEKKSNADSEKQSSNIIDSIPYQVL